MTGDGYAGSIARRCRLTESCAPSQPRAAAKSTMASASPGVGKVKARRTMDEIGIADTRRVRGLGEQQRKALLAAFP